MKKIFCLLSSLCLALLVFAQKSDCVYVGGKCYETVNRFSEGVAVVFKDKKAGYVNEDGNLVIEAKFEFADDFSQGLGLAKMDGNYGFINKEGSWEIKPKYKNAKSFSEGLAAASEDGKRWGYINKKGKWVIPPKFIGAYPFSEEYAIVSFSPNRFSFINKKGEVTMNKTFDRSDAFKGGLAKVKKHNRYGFIDKTGKNIVAMKYDYAYDFYEGLAMVESKGKHGFVNKKGWEVIAAKYKYATGFSDGVAVVTRDEGSLPQVIDKSGKNLFVNTIYKDIRPYYNGTAIAEAPDGKSVLIDKSGNQITGTRLDLMFNGEADSDNLELLYFRNNNLFGYMNRKGIVVIPAQFSDARAFKTDGYAEAELDGRHVVINEKGQVL